MNYSTIQPYNNSTIQPFNHSTFQPFNLSTIQPFSHSTIQPFNHSTPSHSNQPTFESPFESSAIQITFINSTLQPFNPSTIQLLPNQILPIQINQHSNHHSNHRLFKLSSTLQPFESSAIQPFSPSTLQPFNPSNPAHSNQPTFESPFELSAIQITFNLHQFTSPPILFHNLTPHHHTVIFSIHYIHCFNLYLLTIQFLHFTHQYHCRHLTSSTSCPVVSGSRTHIMGQWHIMYRSWSTILIYGYFKIRYLYTNKQSEHRIVQKKVRKGVFTYMMQLTFWSRHCLINKQHDE